MLVNRLGWLGALSCCILALPARGAEPDARGIDFFEKKIRPVLIAKCYRCHSEDAVKSKKLKGGLLLDSRAGLLKGGDTGPAVLPGKADDSLLLVALRQDGELKMPPSAKLADEVLADFAAWIKMGAPDPRDGQTVVAKKEIDVETGRKFWAFQPLQAIPPPKVQHETWVRTPVDRFILARLEAKGIIPNGAARRETLIRRVYFDLLGLPPTPAEIDSFVKDAAPNAYEQLIDRLLQSPHHGERWARHWLDVARFAESGGYEFDKDRPTAFHYRDWVIKALNEDMPFDEFVRMQIAGDRLKQGDLMATAATGFLVAGPYPGQTTSKTLALIRYNHLDDMVSTLGSSLLGLSLGCARCHDHKYDPLPQQDYYRLIANLARTDSAEVKINPDEELYRQAKQDFDQAHAAVVADLDRFEKEQLPERLDTWLQDNIGKATPPWLILEARALAGKVPLKRQSDGSALADAKAGKNETYTFTAQTSQRGITALRLEGLLDSSLPKMGPGRAPDGSFRLTEIDLRVAPLGGAKAKVKGVAVKLKAVEATSAAKGHPLTAALDGKKMGWSAGSPGEQRAVFVTETPIGFESGTQLTVTLKFEGGYALGRPRLAISAAPVPAAGEPAEAQATHELLAVLKVGQGKLTAQNREQVARWLRLLDSTTNVAYVAVEKHATAAPKPNQVGVFAAASGKGGDVHFLVRGEPERKKDVAKPGFVQVLMNTPARDALWLDKEKGADPRIGLAAWLTDAEHGAGHLVARVIVNRLWQHHMGRGLVATPNDFGAQGERPSHPELLDFLAAELIKGGWKLRPIHRLILTSSVYMEDGSSNPASLQTDPLNRLWWRRPARRLDAEEIRDALLAVSGTLEPTLYGSGTLNEASPRRSIYLKVKRSQPVPLLQMFDAPEAIQSVGERASTTVATQSLAMLNSPFVRQRAEKLAERVRTGSAVDLPRIVEQAYLHAVGRRPVLAESERMLALIGGEADNYGGRGRNAALADCCQVLLCLNEFVYVE